MFQRLIRLNCGIAAEPLVFTCNLVEGSLKIFTNAVLQLGWINVCTTLTLKNLADVHALLNLQTGFDLKRVHAAR